MDKRVSIILSTYNEGPIIEQTISEVFKYIKNVEIILVDDNSSDGTLEKVKKINNPNLKIFSRKFRGLASAFLLGLINSSGDIVGWIDSNMGILAKRFPVIRQGQALRAGSDGVQIWPEIAPQPGDIVMEKIRQSGFMYTRLEATIKELEVEHLLVAGVATGACVECTARDAVARDYSVILLSDVTSASGLPDLGWGEVDSETLQRVFLTNFAYHFGKVAATNELLNGPLAMDSSKQA